MRGNGEMKDEYVVESLVVQSRQASDDYPLPFRCFCQIEQLRYDKVFVDQDVISRNKSGFHKVSGM